MGNLYDAIDVAWSWNGDLETREGDLYTSQDDALRSILDQVAITCGSSYRDWVIYPGRGAGLDDFIGEPNTRTTGDRIHDKLRLALVSSGIVQEADLQIRVVPVHIHRILIIIRINAMATAFNQLRSGDVLQTAVVFDTSERQVFFLDKKPELTNW